jgi:hypothetical protein
VTTGVDTVATGIVAVTLVVTAGGVTVAVVTGVDSVIGASPNPAGCCGGIGRG